MILLQFRRVKNSKLYLAFIVGFFVLALTYVFYRIVRLNQVNADPLYYLSNTLHLSYGSFFFFLFFSFEFLYTQKENHFLECLESYPRSEYYFYFSAIAMQMIFLVIFTLILLSINIIIFYLKVADRLEYLVHIGINLLLNIFLVGFVAIMLAVILSFFSKRRVAYLAMVLTSILVSPMSEVISVPLERFTGLNIYNFFEMFNIFPPMLRNSPLNSFGFSVLPYRFYQIFFWIFIFIAYFIYKIRHKNHMKQKVCAFISFIFALTCLVSYFRPASKVTKDKLNPSSGIFSDALYYANPNFVTETEWADFSIKSYELRFEIGSQLSASCTLKVNRPLMEEDHFTLYHGFTVHKVLDANGQSINYKRNGDYITISKGNTKNIQEIYLEYSGSGTSFYSNVQAVFLPGHFPYYPFPGKIQLFSTEMQSFLPRQLPEKASFLVEVKSRLKLFSNLVETADNHFSGQARSLTLLAGMYDDCQDESGVVVYYPYLAQKDFNKSMFSSEISHAIQNDSDIKKIKQLFIMDNMNFVSSYSQCLRFDDYVLSTGIRGLNQMLEDIKLPWQKQTIASVHDVYVNFKDIYQAQLDNAYLQKQNTESGNITDDVFLFFSTGVRTLGEHKFLKLVELYLEEDADMRSSMQFMTDLSHEFKLETEDE